VHQQGTCPTITRLSWLAAGVRSLLSGEQNQYGVFAGVGK